MVLLKDVMVLVSLASFTTWGAAEGTTDSLAPTGDNAGTPGGVPGVGGKAGLPVILEAAPDPGHIIHKAHGQHNRYQDDREHTRNHQENANIVPPQAVHAYGVGDGEGDQSPLFQGHSVSTLAIRDMIENGLNALTERDAHPFVQAISNVFASFGKRGESGAPAVSSEAPPSTAGEAPAAGAPAHAPVSGPPTAAGDIVNAAPAGGAASVATNQESGAIVADAANNQKATVPQGGQQGTGYSKEPQSSKPFSYWAGREGTHAGRHRKGVKHLITHRKGMNGRIPKSGPSAINPQPDLPLLDEPPRKAMSRLGLRRRQMTPTNPYQPDLDRGSFGPPKRLGAMPNAPDSAISYRQMRAPQMQPSTYQLPAKPLRNQKAPSANMLNQQNYPLKPAPRLTSDEASSGRFKEKSTKNKYEDKEAFKKKYGNGNAKENVPADNADTFDDEAEPPTKPSRSKSKSKPPSSKSKFNPSAPYDEGEEEEEEEEKEPSSPRSKSASFQAPALKPLSAKEPSRDAYDSDDFDNALSVKHSAQFHVKHEMVRQT